MRYPTSNADFFNTGEFNSSSSSLTAVPSNSQIGGVAPTHRNTFSFENTTSTSTASTSSSSSVGLHQRKMPQTSSMNALPTHVRNRSSGGVVVGTGGGGGNNTPTTINFGSGGGGQTTPPTNQRQNSLGFDNTATFLGTTASNEFLLGSSGMTGASGFHPNNNNIGIINSTGDLFGGNNNNNNSNISVMGRTQSSNIDAFDEENEPPLLEELGIRPSHIRDKVILVLNPFSQVSGSSHELCMDEDLAGPITFVVALGFLLTLQGKVHFGAIYGTSVVGILLSYFLLTMMSREVPVRTTLVVSTLGYCLLPDLLLAIFVTLHMVFVGGGSVGVFLPMLCLVTVTWSAWCAMKIFAEAFQLDHAKYLILYPSFLFYAVFAAITMF